MNFVISKTLTVRIITGLMDKALNNYPENAWLKNNGGHDLPDCEPKYMKWHDPDVFDYVVEMTAEEKAIVDSTEIESVRAKKINNLNVIARTEIELDEWKLSRHERQIVGNFETSITNEEYLAIVEAHQTIRNKVNTKELCIENCETVEDVERITWDSIES